MNRKKVTANLTQAATGYLVKKMFSVHTEVGLQRGGRMRADLLALNLSKEFIIVEVKSCWADYTSDTKWQTYLSFADKMYFMITEDLWEKKKDILVEDLKPHGIGVLIHTKSGSVACVKNAKKLETVDPDFKDWLILKLAWRGGDSRMNMKRIRKVKYEI